jgi:uncharacterized membrane protein YczE
MEYGVLSLFITLALGLSFIIICQLGSSGITSFEYGKGEALAVFVSSATLASSFIWVLYIICTTILSLKRPTDLSSVIDIFDVVSLTRP